MKNEQFRLSGNLLFTVLHNLPKPLCDQTGKDPALHISLSTFYVRALHLKIGSVVRFFCSHQYVFVRANLCEGSLLLDGVSARLLDCTPVCVRVQSLYVRVYLCAFLFLYGFDTLVCVWVRVRQSRSRAHSSVSDHIRGLARRRADWNQKLLGNQTVAEKAAEGRHSLG